MSDHVNLERWTDSEILMLPDHAFGSRVVVSLTRFITAGTVQFRVIPTVLPDRIVIWEIVATATRITALDHMFGLRLGRDAPADEAEWNTLEDLWRAEIDATADAEQFVVSVGGNFALTRLKTLVNVQGRRLITRMENSSASDSPLNVNVVYSAVPRSVPAWILGSQNGVR